MKFIFEQIRVGGDRNFSYIIGDREAKEALVIDPSYNPEKVLERCSLSGLKVSGMIITHGHHDHLERTEVITQQTSCLVLASAFSSFSHDISLNDNESYKIGSYNLRFLHTPGHAIDHLVVIVDSHKIILTADLIFVGKVGGTKTEDDSTTQWSSIQKVLSEVDEDYSIWPGHDYGCRPSSTIKLELSSNPFVMAKSLDEFLEVKKNWSEIKINNGLI